jgi:hypothetical protein
MSNKAGGVYSESRLSKMVDRGGRVLFALAMSEAANIVALGGGDFVKCPAQLFYV